MSSDFAGELSARIDAMLSPWDEAGDQAIHESTIGIGGNPFNAGLTSRRYSLTGQGGSLELVAVAALMHRNLENDERAAGTATGDVGADSLSALREVFDPLRRQRGRQLGGLPPLQRRHRGEGLSRRGGAADQDGQRRYARQAQLTRRLSHRPRMRLIVHLFQAM